MKPGMIAAAGRVIDARLRRQVDDISHTCGRADGEHAAVTADGDGAIVDQARVALPETAARAVAERPPERDQLRGVLDKEGGTVGWEHSRTLAGHFE